MEARSCNHCYRGKAISITHSECVLAALDVQHAMRMRHNVICGLPRSTVLIHVISQTALVSGEKILSIKRVFLFPPQILFQTCLILRAERERKMSIGLHAQYCCYSCPILMKLEFFLQFFEKYVSIKFHENPPHWSRVVACRRTDRRAEANSRFWQFCERA